MEEDKKPFKPVPKTYDCFKCKRNDIPASEWNSYYGICHDCVNESNGH